MNKIPRWKKEKTNNILYALFSILIDDQLIKAKWIISEEERNNFIMKETQKLIDKTWNKFWKKTATKWQVLIEKASSM